MTMADHIRAKLSAAFQPVVLEIVDDSARHSGHAGARPGGETHFNIRIVAAAFSGLSRLERQRRVYQVLSAELNAQIHALSVHALAPGEKGA